MRLSLSSKLVGGTGQAALALESIDIKDMCTEGREELVFRELDQRFPDKVAADRMGEAMEEAFGLKILKKETTEAFTGRSTLVFTRPVGSTRVRCLAWMSTCEAGSSMICAWRS